MTDLLDLYGLAEEHGTEIYWFDLGTAESLSLPLEDGSCAIAMDPWRMSTLADEKVKLAHDSKLYPFNCRIVRISLTHNFSPV